MIVMKFGGSSLGNGKRILYVAKLTQKMRESEQIVVIASAMVNVTDKLIMLFQNYKVGKFKAASEQMKELYILHKQALNELRLTRALYEHAEVGLLKLFGDLSMYITLHTHFSSADYDYIISFGERLSSYLLSIALCKIGEHAEVIFGSEVIVATMQAHNAKALLKETKKKAKKSLDPLLKKNITPVVTGFFAATKKKTIVTLGRGGSDYSATIIAHALNAKEVILWKEIDGVFSEDPKVHREAIFFPQLSYNEALSLARKGAKILHPEAMEPVASKNITVWVKNTFKPKLAGTKIWKGITI